MLKGSDCIAGYPIEKKTCSNQSDHHPSILRFLISWSHVEGLLIASNLNNITVIRHFHHQICQIIMALLTLINQFIKSSGKLCFIFYYPLTRFIDQFYQQYINMIKHTEPFLHYSIENFLPEQKYQQLTAIYSHLQFLEKESDLFHFYQTNELAQEPSLDFFKKELSGKFKEITTMKETTYNIFASYYFKGNYLLCHDDVVEDRKFAFSYYLEDHPSGELVLYDNTASKVVKKVKVKKNLLVIFQVSNISYHEVALSKTDGRKAVTGWLNQKGQGAKRPVKVIPPYQPILPADLIKFKFPQDITGEEYYNFPGVQYQFNIEEKILTGPFYERKVWRLKLSENVVMDLKGYILFSTEFLKFERGHYMLLNDPVNSLGDDILDVFILQEPKGHHEGEFIRIVGQSGEVQGTIDYSTDTMFIVHREKKNYYIDPVEKEINVAHLIYRKAKAKKEKTPQLTAKAVKDKRGEMTKKKQEKLQAILAGKSKGGKSKPIEKKTTASKGKARRV